MTNGRPASIAVVGTTATTPRDRSISMMSNLSPNRSDIYGQPAIVYPYLQVNDYCIININYLIIRFRYILIPCGLFKNVDKYFRF